MTKEEWKKDFTNILRRVAIAENIPIAKTDQFEAWLDVSGDIFFNSKADYSTPNDMIEVFKETLSCFRDGKSFLEVVEIIQEKLPQKD